MEAARGRPKLYAPNSRLAGRRFSCEVEALLLRIASSGGGAAQDLSYCLVSTTRQAEVGLPVEEIEVVWDI
jgi:hypothetical protein